MKGKENLTLKQKAIEQNRVWVRITSICNNKCIFCLDAYAYTDNDKFTLDSKVKDEIKKGYKKGYENRVIISGGEASINPNFQNYIKYAKEIGYDRVQTVTNGNAFADEGFCKKVFDAGLEETTFSFHGHNSSLHDYLVGTPGAFKKSLKGLLFIKKNYPNVIVNIDIVVNKINIKYLPDIVKFFMKLKVYEFDILQIVPFGRGFNENRKKLFYNIDENIGYLHKTWELSNIWGTCMWTNRFPVEAFEGYEYLIQDPGKIGGDVMGESRRYFEPFIKTNGKKKLKCLGEACNYCFQKGYCFEFIDNVDSKKINIKNDYELILGEKGISETYKKYGNTADEFKENLKNIGKELINIPKCLGGTGIYQTYNDFKVEGDLEEYTNTYIKNLYRKKGLKCKKCIYNNECSGIYINFIRSYGFKILSPILR